MHAITGITGQVGGQLARRLRTRGTAVRAVLRDAAKAQPWRDAGCDIALADLDDRAAVTRAFTGVDGVFVLLPPTFDPSPGYPEAQRTIATLRAALDAARPAKVVCLSTIGARAAHPNLLNQLGLLEEALETLPMPVTFLRAAWFVENVVWDIDTARRTGRLPSHLQPVDRRIPMVATADIAAVAAACLEDAGSGVRVVELEGPSRVSPDDLAAALGRALARDVRAEAIPRDGWEAGFRAQGMRNPLPRMQMLDGFNAGWIDFDVARSRKGETTVDAVIAAQVARAA